MTTPYKLNQDIVDFVINQKKSSPTLSCRKLSILLKEKKQIKLSKSLINRLIKENKLSSPVGRRRTRKLTETIPVATIPTQKPIEALTGKKLKKEIILRGGVVFLLAADYRLNLTSLLAQNLAPLLAGYPNESLQSLLQFLVLNDAVKDRESLENLLDREVPAELLAQFTKLIEGTPFSEIKEAIAKSGIKSNPIDINDLYEKCLLRLNAHAQFNFFPKVYQSFEYADMLERFYALPAKIERREGAIKFHLLCPAEFPWKDDFVWQEDLAFAAKKLNEFRISTSNKEALWISPRFEALPTSLI